MSKSGNFEHDVSEMYENIPPHPFFGAVQRQVTSGEKNLLH